MTSCEWRICHAASVSSQRSSAPRGGIDSDDFELQTLRVFMWAFPHSGWIRCPEAASPRCNFRSIAILTFHKHTQCSMGPLCLLHIVAPYVISH
jgi:hypothetical protein